MKPKGSTVRKKSRSAPVRVGPVQPKTTAAGWRSASRTDKDAPDVLGLQRVADGLAAVFVHRTGLNAVSDTFVAEIGDVRRFQTPRQLMALAHERGLDGPDTKAGPIVAWLKEEYDVGRGHAMAMVHVIKKGPQISAKHVGSTGTHRDESATLRLDGKAARESAPDVA